MSPRATRIYGWLQRRGIGLTPFSTDQCVAGYLSQLQVALTVLEASDGAGIHVDHRRTMIVDLRAIMGRLPATRATQANAAQGSGAGTDVLDGTGLGGAPRDDSAAQGDGPATETDDSPPGYSGHHFAWLEVD